MSKARDGRTAVERAAYAELRRHLTFIIWEIGGTRYDDESEELIQEDVDTVIETLIEQGWSFTKRGVVIGDTRD